MDGSLVLCGEGSFLPQGDSMAVGFLWRGGSFNGCCDVAYIKCGWQELGPAFVFARLRLGKGNAS